MANKYAHIAKALAAERRKARMCTNKARFADQAAAFQKGQNIYECPYCKGWHRSGSAVRMAVRLRRKRV